MAAPTFQATLGLPDVGDTAHVPIFRRRRGEVEQEPAEIVLSDADRIWNRAACEHGGPVPADGDTALASLLSVHNLAMNGGLLHSVQNHSQDQIERAIAGYRYFGFDDAAAVVESVARRAASIDLDADDDVAERLEIDADESYAAAVPDDDATLAASFEQLYERRPEAFSPLR
jgi:hypothetical protein